jgi:hypothetical protein
MDDPVAEEQAPVEGAAVAPASMWCHSSFLPLSQPLACDAVIQFLGHVHQLLHH